MSISVALAITTPLTWAVTAAMIFASTLGSVRPRTEPTRAPSRVAKLKLPIEAVISANSMMLKNTRKKTGVMSANSTNDCPAIRRLR